MADIKDIISNIENIYGSNNSLSLLKDFERVIDSEKGRNRGFGLRL